MIESDWKEKGFDSIGYFKYKVKRTLYIDKYPNPKYKYKEKIDFNGSEKCKPYAVCIGFNPAATKSDIDVTNKRLIKLLKKDYGGYFLFNIYPEIADNIKQLNFNDENNQSFVDQLVNILNEEEYCDLDIILFFGRMVAIPEQLESFLKEQNEKIFITSHNNEFTHPGSNADIQKKPFEMDFLRKSTCIRVHDK